MDFICNILMTCTQNISYFKAFGAKKVSVFCGLHQYTKDLSIWFILHNNYSICINISELQECHKIIYITKSKKTKIAEVILNILTDNPTSFTK